MTGRFAFPMTLKCESARNTWKGAAVATLDVRRVFQPALGSRAMQGLALGTELGVSHFAGTPP